MTHNTNGFFTIIDGLDGVGKGEVLNAIVDYLEKEGYRVFDLHDYWNEHNLHPDFTNPIFKEKPNPYYVPIDSFDILISSEPTYSITGIAIRNEVITKNNRDYSARATADCYSLDRLILYKRVILPALEANKIIIQSRSVSSSIVYQPIQSTVQGEIPLTIDDIIKLEGNNFALEHAPDLFIIPTIKDVEQIMKRLDARNKKDDAVFENLDFQLKLKPLYESKQLRDIFESRGTIVKYLDAGISIEDTRRQAVDIFTSIYEK
jgi:thymidylate kinase